VLDEGERVVEVDVPGEVVPRESPIGVVKRGGHRDGGASDRFGKDSGGFRVQAGASAGAKDDLDARVLGEEPEREDLRSRRRVRRDQGAVDRVQSHGSAAGSELVRVEVRPGLRVAGVAQERGRDRKDACGQGAQEEIAGPGGDVLEE
jgi:hypothetical protein